MLINLAIFITVKLFTNVPLYVGNNLRMSMVSTTVQKQKMLQCKKFRPLMDFKVYSIEFI